MKRTKTIKNMKRGTVTFVLSSSFPRRQCFSFSYTLANISVASQKSLEVMCCFVSVTAAEDGNDGNSGRPGRRRFSVFCLLVCAHICPGLSLRIRAVVMNVKVVIFES